MGCIGPSIVVLQFGSLYKLSRYYVAITLHNFTSARERLPEPVSNGQISANCLHQHTGSRPFPTPPGRSNYIFLSHSGIKRNQIKVAGNISSSILYHSASVSQKTKQKIVWEESKPRTSAVNENMFQYLYMSGYIYLTCSLLSPYATLPFSLFFSSNIYIKASKKYIKQHVLIHSQLSLNSTQRDKQKSNSSDLWAVVLLSTFQRLWLPVNPVPTVKREVCVDVWWGSGSRLLHLSRGLRADWCTG